jgi:hypothetical protein
MMNDRRRWRLSGAWTGTAVLPPHSNTLWGVVQASRAGSQEDKPRNARNGPLPGRVCQCRGEPPWPAPWPAGQCRLAAGRPGWLARRPGGAGWPAPHPCGLRLDACASETVERLRVHSRGFRRRLKSRPTVAAKPAFAGCCGRNQSAKADFAASGRVFRRRRLTGENCSLSAMSSNESLNTLAPVRALHRLRICCTMGPRLSNWGYHIAMRIHSFQAAAATRKCICP